MNSNKLKFGDLKSIEYVKAKELENLRIYHIHECDCPDCKQERHICPHCDTTEEPEWIEDMGYTYRLCKCKKCGKMAWREKYWKYQNDKIIKEFENLNPNNNEQPK
jgi:hypothetical protein